MAMAISVERTETTSPWLLMSSVSLMKVGNRISRSESRATETRVAAAAGEMSYSVVSPDASRATSTGVVA